MPTGWSTPGTGPEPTLSFLDRRRRVVKVEPPLLPVGGVVGERQVDILRIHVPT
jgi:hypothetical protein